MFFVGSLVLTILSLWVTHQWAIRSFPVARRRSRALAVILGALMVEQSVVGWVAVRWHAHWLDMLHTAGAVVLMSMGIATIPLLVLGLLSWGFAKAIRVDRSPVIVEGSADSAPLPSRRQVVEAAGGIAVLGASSAVLGWGAIRGRHAFELCEVPVRIPGLPRALDGYTIAQISDVHAGIHLAERDLDEALSLVRRARPDLLVVTGDIVDLDWSFASFAAGKIARVAPRDGAFAILGNHDYYAGPEAVVAALHAAGVTVLLDDGRLVRAGDGGGFALLGVDDRSSTRYGRPGPRLDRALSAVPPGAARILLSHQPPTVERWAGQVALQLSGHTHGGQINPGFRPADLMFKYVAGRYEVGETTLYVNRGLGTVGPPSRVGASPEVSRIILVSA